MRFKLLHTIIICSLLDSCKTLPEQTIDHTISVSILPEKYFVNSIGGEKIKVNVMIPPGASHSTYEPTARQMYLLSRSQAYFKIGHLDFEYAWMTRFEGINPAMKIFDLSSRIDLIKGAADHHPGNTESSASEVEKGIDPHIWMSPICVKTIATNILYSLISLYPSDSSEFIINYNSFISQVEEVDSLYRIDAEKLKNRSFIIYHPALAYLARDYGMEQIVLEFDGKEPPPAYIREIIDMARKKNIHSIFVQKQLSIDNSRSLAKEINAEIIRIDPMDENWKEQMKYILHQLLMN
jgi:zinc transport system substrate-binding protein